MDTQVMINLKGLEPNYIYSVTFSLWTEYGKGPASKEYLLETLPCDPPSLVHLISSSTDSLELSWGRPNHVAINVTLDQVFWQLTDTLDPIIITKGFFESGNFSDCSFPMNVEIDRLEPAENYFFHVQAKSSEIKVIYFIFEHYCLCVFIDMI